MRFRFSVDAHAIGQHLTGNEVYVRNLLAGVAALDDRSEFVAYLCDGGWDAPLSVVPARVRRRRVARNSFLRLGWDLTRKVREDRPNLLHVQYTAPLVCPVPVVVSVHDVSFLEHPEYFTRARAMQLRLTVKRTVERAARVLTPSEFSRRCVEQHYPAAKGKVEVVPIAAAAHFRPVSREQSKSQNGLRVPYILTIGDLQPRKNQIGLIRAFANLVGAYPQVPHHLVIAGKDTWYGENVRTAARESGVGERIHFTGWVSDEEVLALYGGCDIFAFPSHYEGFGLPVVEAMACGRAVACSSATALPEVADSCALVFDPNSTAEMVRALRDLALDAELRGRMERLGQQRASLFTWELTAQRTLDVYYAVAGGGAARPSVRSRQLSAVRS